MSTEKIVSGDWELDVASSHLKLTEAAAQAVLAEKAEDIKHIQESISKEINREHVERKVKARVLSEIDKILAELN